jgi:DNA-binding XRE family transcriptional regulator
MIVIDREADTVAMSRAEYKALIEAAEDAEDLAHLAAQEERERVLGIDAARRDYLPGGLVKRMLEGEHPVRLWREQRGLTLSNLAARAGVAVSYLSEIESGRKPGSVGAFRKLAKALDLGVDDLVP